jgi:hypothetical protein
MPAPPIQASPDETAEDASPNRYSAAQSETPGMTVLSVVDGSHAGAAGAGAAAAGASERVTSRTGARRRAALAGSGGSCRAATASPSRRPEARISRACRPSTRRPTGAIRAASPEP